jgi:hypothetical protein
MAQENLQFAGNHLLVSRFAFNIGIELGQLLVLAMMLPALLLVRRYVLPGKVGMIILSALVAQTGWQWMMERGNALLSVPWPRPSVAGLATPRSDRGNFVCCRWLALHRETAALR